jgi:hypothetical protein
VKKAIAVVLKGTISATTVAWRSRAIRITAAPVARRAARPRPASGEAARVDPGRFRVAELARRSTRTPAIAAAAGWPASLARFARAVSVSPIAPRTSRPAMTHAWRPAMTHCTAAAVTTPADLEKNAGVAAAAAWTAKPPAVRERVATRVWAAKPAWQDRAAPRQPVALRVRVARVALVAKRAQAGRTVKQGRRWAGARPKAWRI